MISVVVCEDDTKQLNRMVEVIEKYIMIEELDMKISIATNDPEAVLEYIAKNPNEMRVYFLDVDLNHKFSGLSLASEIRKSDYSGKIVFVTTHGELSYLTFTYKVEAMDYILKDVQDEVERRIRECINLAIKHFTMEANNQSKIFKIKVGERIRSIPYEEILFFESGLRPHRITLHTKHRQLEFYDSIKNLEEKNSCLFRCHQSFVVNKNNIKSINKSTHMIEMVNGEELPLSIRAIRKLKS